jgi:hypothetical protein
LEFLHDTPEFQERYGMDKAVVFWQICVWDMNLMNCVLGSYWPEEVHGLPTHKKLIDCLLGWV